MAIEMVVMGPPRTVVKGKTLDELIESCIKNVARKASKLFCFRAQNGTGDAYEVEAPLTGRRGQEEVDPVGSRSLILQHIQAGAVLTF